MANEISWSIGRYGTQIPYSTRIALSANILPNMFAVTKLGLPTDSCMIRFLAGEELVV